MGGEPDQEVLAQRARLAQHCSSASARELAQSTAWESAMIRDFRELIAKGNVMDLAVGIIIGAAFTAIVNSLVADIINPIIGLIIGGADFSNLYYVMSGTVPDSAGLQVARDSGAAVFAYGAFITAIINF